MNKGFFVVFLGIVVGAMALIFFNQASRPGALPRESAAVRAPVKQEPPVPPVPAALPVAEPPASPADKPAEASVAEKSERPESVPAKIETQRPEPPKPVASATESARVKPETAKPEPAPEAKPTPVKIEKAPVAGGPVIPAPIKKISHLKNISLQFKDKGVAIRIEADGGFSYKTFFLPKPDRYVVDLGGKWEGMHAPSIPSNKLVKGARVGSQDGGPRMVLDLTRAPVKHKVAWIAPTVLEIYLE